MNLEATINWVLLENKARDMGARRRLGLEMRMAAAELELAEWSSDSQHLPKRQVG